MKKEVEIPKILQDKDLADRIIEFGKKHKDLTNKNMCTKHGIAYLMKKYPVEDASFVFCAEFEFEGRKYKYSGIKPYICAYGLDNQGGFRITDVETGLFVSYHVGWDPADDEEVLCEENI